MFIRKYPVLVVIVVVLRGEEEAVPFTVALSGLRLVVGTSLARPRKEGKHSSIQEWHM